MHGNAHEYNAWPGAIPKAAGLPRRYAPRNDGGGANAPRNDGGG